MLDVVALGELLIDFAPLGISEDGYPNLAAKPGGAPGNYLAALAAYGAKTAFIGKVGNDVFGRLLLSTLRGAGIETTGILVDDQVFTTLAFVTLDENGDRSFSFSRKPGADTCLRFEEIDLSIIDEAKVFHFGSLSLTNEPVRNATKSTVEYAAKAKKLITYDPNLRPSLWNDPVEAKRQMLWGLQYADIVKMSGEEVEFLWGCSPMNGAKRLLHEFGTRLAMITLGTDGCIMRNKNAVISLSSPAVNAVDTTGAGDIFGGSAVSRLLKLNTRPEELTEEALYHIGSFACAAASLSTQKFGGIPSIPAEEAVAELMGV